MTPEELKARKAIGLGDDTQPPSPYDEPRFRKAIGLEGQPLPLRVMEIKNSAQFSGDANPIKEARFQHQSRMLGIPVESIRAFPENANDQYFAQSIDANKLAESTPVTARTVATVDGMRQYKTSLSQLATIEQAAAVARAPSFTWGDLSRTPGGYLKGLGGATNELGINLGKMLALPALGVDWFASNHPMGKPTTTSQDFVYRTFVDPLVANQKAFSTENEGFLTKLAGAFGSATGLLSQTVLGGPSAPASAAVEQAPKVAAALKGLVEHGIKSATLPAVSSGMSTASEVYDATGGDGGSAAAAGVAQYGSTALQLMLPLTITGPLKTRVPVGAVAGVAGGEAGRQIMNPVLPEGMRRDFDIEQAALDAVLGGTMSLAGPKGANPKADALVRKTYVDAQKAGEATQGAEAVRKIMDAAAEVEVRAEDPQGFKQFVQEVAIESNTKDLYVDVRTFTETLNQNGITVDELTRTMPEVAAQITEATQTNGLVRIPIAEYATHIAGSKLDEALFPSLQTTADGMTFKQAELYQQDLARGEMLKDAERIIEAKEQDAEYQAQIKQVYDSALGEIGKTGRFNEKTNKAYATMHTAFVTTQAERKGVTPAEFMAAYPLQVRAESVAGVNALDQNTPAFSEFVKQFADNKPIDNYTYSRGLKALKAEIVNDWASGNSNKKTGSFGPDEIVASLRKENTTKYFDDDGDSTAEGSNRYAELEDALAEKYAKEAIGDPQREAFDLTDPSDAANVLRDYFEANGLEPNMVGGSGKSQSKYFTLGDGTEIRVSDHELPDQYDQRANENIVLPDDAGKAMAVLEEVAKRYVKSAQAKQTDTPAFKQWFRESKVVDDNGMPLVLYRGQAAKHNAENLLDRYYTSDKVYASSYGDGDGENVLPVYVNMRHPYFLDEHNEVTDWAFWKRRDELIAKGYDGIATSDRQIWFPFDTTKTTEQVNRGANALEGNAENSRVKSAIGNRGTFDRNDSNILNQDALGKISFSPDIKEGVNALDQNTPAFKQWFRESKVLDAEGKPLVVYHGTARPDRVGTQFRKTRATSGPMAYFTDDPDVASNYATGKQDTSALRDEDSEFRNWFQKKIGRSTYNIEQLWHQLSPEQKKSFSERIYDVRENEDTGLITYEKDQGFPAGRKKDWQEYYLPREGKGNPITAAVEVWLSSGSLFGEEHRFLQVLKAAGLDTSGIEYRNPSDSSAFVYPVYLSIQTPLDTQNIPQSVVDALEAKSKRQRAKTTNGLDQWDKQLRSGPEWMAEMRADIAEGRNPHAWTSIPDWVTATLKDFGYDGIRDTGGKFAGTSHGVWIPFGDNQVKSATGNKGAYRRDKNGILDQDALGKISFSPDIKEGAVISLLKDANLSTFLHESAHWYLEVSLDMARAPNADLAVLKDLNALLSWSGAGDLAQWDSMTFEARRIYHEKIARGFEAYLMTGKAPTVELQTIFSRMRAWMLDVYTKLSNLQAPLTPEVTQVFDRWLATDAAITKAENTRQMAKLFASKPEGMSDADYAAYQALGAEATSDAMDELGARGMRDMKWMSNAKNAAIKALQKEARVLREETREQVAAEVNAEPVNMLLRFLKTGETTGPNGEEIKILEGFKLNAQAVKDAYPETMNSRPDTARLKGLTSKDGLSPEILADMFGFTSPDHLMRTLMEREDAKAKIEGITDQRMLQEHGELTDAVAIERAAEEAIHNDVRARFIATEFKALTQAIGSPRDIWKAAKLAAETAVQGKRLRDLTPGKYAAAESRAAKASMEAHAKGDTALAAIEKRAQLLNNQLVASILREQEIARNGAVYLKKFGNEGTRKNLDPDYRDQIDAILENYDLKTRSQKETDSRQSYAKWAIAQEEAGNPAVLTAEEVAALLKTPIKNMTVQQFGDLLDLVKNIDHLARLKHKLLTLEGTRQFNEVTRQASESIRENATKTVPERLEKRPLESLFMGARAIHRKAASLFREMDGWKDGGAMWEIFSRGANRAADWQAEANVKAANVLGPLMDAVRKEGGMRDMLYIPEIKNSLSRNARLSIALQWGNETGRRRVMAGDRWTEQQAQAVVDTLSKSEWAYVQGVLDHINTYWTDVAAKQRRVTGITPEKVDAMPIETKYGTYPGGYYPIAYDPDRSTRAESDQKAATLKQATAGAYGSASTRRGHTRARVEDVQGRPVAKTIDTVFRHVDQVIHDLAWHEYLIDANRVLKEARVEAAIREHYGVEVLRTLQANLEDIATGFVPPKDAFEKVLAHARTGTSIAGLAWNFTTGALQPLGLAMSAVRIGPEWVGRGLMEWAGSAAKMESALAFAHGKSSMMRRRADTLSRDIFEVRGKLEDKSALRERVEESFFYFITKFQIMADLPTWLGQYQKALAENPNDDARAAALADQAVLDSQGGGAVKDLSQIQRGGPLLKMFTVFYSYMNVVHNMAAEVTGRTEFKDPAQFGRAIGDYLLIFVLPSVAGTLMKAAIKNELDDDELGKKVAADQLNYVLGTMVGMRELGAGAAGAMGQYSDYSGPAGIRLLNEINNLAKQAGQGEADKAALKAANNVAGIVLHYPSGAVQRGAEAVAAMVEGDTKNPLTLLTGPPKK